MRVLLLRAHYLIGRKLTYLLENTPNSSLAALILAMLRDTRSFATYTHDIVPKCITTVTITVTGMPNINNSRSLTVGCRICNVHCNDSTRNVTATDSKQRRWRQRQRAAAPQHEALYYGILKTLSLFENSHTIYH